MTDSIITRATQALAKSQCGSDDLDGLEEEFVAKLREDVRAVIAAMREPDEAMMRGTYQPDKEYDIWQGMIDDALAEP